MRGASRRASVIGDVDAARRTLLLTEPTLSDTTCYLWRNFATTGSRSNEYEIYLPFAAGRYGVYTFRDYIATSGGANYFGRFKEGVPVTNLASNNAAVTKTGTWAASANAAIFNGTALQSSTAGDTMSASVTGHTLIIRTIITTNGGFGLVSIDGSATAANRLPAVVQADVDAGFFAAGDLGKRYIECYANGTFEDEHLVLADGLSDAAHTVLITVKGTKRAASSAARVYVAGFCGGRATTLLTDSGASMGYVRDVSNLRSPNTFSQMTTAPEYTPSGFSNFQYMGGNHGNETLTAQQFKVDGSVSAPAAGVLVSGTQIKHELTANMTHPSTGATVVCAKTDSFTGRAGVMQYDYSLAWANAGTGRSSYYGMMHVGKRQYPVSVLENTEFNRFLVGNTTVSTLSLNNESSVALSLTDLCAAYSTAHDTVALVYLPRLDLNVDSYARLGTGAFLQDRSDLTEKLYFARSSTTGTEAITNGTTHTGQVQWRMLRLTGAASALAG